MPFRIITLTTDFGGDSPYVAQMKAALLSVTQDVLIVDVSHAISPQNVREGALVLADTVFGFPAGTIHVAVVDPGVGTSRPIVYVQLGEHHFVAPDNGLLSYAARVAEPQKLIEISNPAYWRPEVSATFHGRDIMAPVAGQLASGVDPDLLGTPVTTIKSLEWPTLKVGDRRLDAVVLAVDRFGNLITNVSRGDIPSQVSLDQITVCCAGAEVCGVVQTYGNLPAGSLAALFGSSDRLEIAEVNGDAAKRLDASFEAAVNLSW